MRIYIVALLLIFSCHLQAQIITGISTKWSDEFSEWTIWTDDEEIEGELTRRWQMRDDWTEWDYRIGEEVGSIRQKRKGDPTHWEIRGYDDIVTAKMAWRDDIRTWKITNNSKYITLTTRYGNMLDEWILRDETNGIFHMYTELEQDPRDWIIVDKLDEDISFTMKVALMFIACYHGSPNR